LSLISRTSGVSLTEILEVNKARLKGIQLDQPLPTGTELLLCSQAVRELLEEPPSKCKTETKWFWHTLVRSQKVVQLGNQPGLSVVGRAVRPQLRLWVGLTYNLSVHWGLPPVSAVGTHSGQEPRALQHLSSGMLITCIKHAYSVLTGNREVATCITSSFIAPCLCHALIMDS
jgi:hypothetical protein